MLMGSQALFAQTAQQYMRNGQEALLERQYEEALRFFEDVIRLDPDYPGAVESRGNVLFAMGEYAEAERAYSEALEDYLRKKYVRTGRETEIERGGLVVVGPDPGSPSSSSLAAVYNNRGVARYHLGYKNDAIRDFDDALRIDSNFEAARRNLRLVDTGAASRENADPADRFGTADENRRRQKPGRDSYDRYSSKYERPINQLQSRNDKSNPEMVADFREERLEILDLNGRSRGGLFKPKPFESRKVNSRGKTYREPKVASQTANYVSIQSVTITTRSTLVTLTISNPDQRAYEVAVDPPRSEGAFFLTDRAGGGRRFPLKNLKGIDIYPRVSELPKGETLTLQLEFPKIPNTMGFVNLIEGKKNREDAWNFYGINLAK